MGCHMIKVKVIDPEAFAWTESDASFHPSSRSVRITQSQGTGNLLWLHRAFPRSQHGHATMLARIRLTQFALPDILRPGGAPNHFSVLSSLEFALAEHSALSMPGLLEAPDISLFKGDQRQITPSINIERGDITVGSEATPLLQPRQ